MITGDVRRAIARAVAAEGLPPAAPGLRPAGGAGRYGSSVAFALSEHPPALAARLAARIGREGGIARADVTGPGFITITIDPGQLEALPERIAAAGPGCAASDALSGVVVPAPPGGDPLAAASWEKARAALAAQLTASLAAAAGATVALPGSMERTVSSSGTQALTARGEATDRYFESPAQPWADPRPPETEPAGTIADAAPDHRGRREVPPAGPPPETELSAAVAFAGADAVRFALARAVPGRRAAIDPVIIARHVMGNPAYAVRYAHARAASGVRWAATSCEPAAAPRHRPADPGELVLLDALSWLPERVAAAARRGRPDEFARYLEELASAAIAALIGAGPGSARVPPADRLSMATAARTGLAAGLGLLGVSAPGRL